MAVTDFSAFRTLALAYCAVDGSAYIGDTTDTSSNTAFLAVANEVIRRFSEETLCLFEDQITFTLTNGTQTYSLRDTAVFSKEIVQVQRVYVNANPLDEISENNLSLVAPKYITDTSGLPTVWYTKPPEQIGLWRKPDSAYSNSYASGWYVHPTITAESGAGGTLFFRPEDLRCVARETAIAILEPRALGTSLQRLDRLRAQNQAEKVKIKARAESLFEGPVERREGRTVYNLR